ncbi:heavy metal-associated domain-containing protein [Polaribacter sp. PL03]|uniref:heavy metal-associated domain-containing protein n=1 Tax=Polaribacter sp. PL03 TaxID=3088353 RepID=UPI0029D0C565|nr:heavy metal-associated domain-containing protein [Polaribacter sp. PL03]MDX6745729.1 heavy metal-associated domain-containing protein [Polaribacter sp. PL03]
MMTTKKIFFSIAIACFVFIGCNKEVKKENVSLAISGMTCEIGCAKTIQSKLSKKEGVIDAKVVFTDSIANIEFDANTTSKKDLIAYVNGIAGGDLYKASEASEISNKTVNSTKTHVCSDSCKENCELKANKKGCCSGANVDGKMVCADDCKMACCVQETE